MSDTDFKWSDMRAKFNNELIANLGNFLNRALSFTASKLALPPSHPQPVHESCKLVLSLQPIMMSLAY